MTSLRDLMVTIATGEVDGSPQKPLVTTRTLDAVFDGRTLRIYPAAQPYEELMLCSVGFEGITNKIVVVSKNGVALEVVLRSVEMLKELRNAERQRDKD